MGRALKKKKKKKKDLNLSTVSAQTVLFSRLFSVYDCPWKNVVSQDGCLGGLVLFSWLSQSTIVRGKKLFLKMTVLVVSAA